MNPCDLGLINYGTNKLTFVHQIDQIMRNLVDRPKQ